MSDYYPDFPNDVLGQLSTMVRLQEENPDYILLGEYPEPIQRLFLALNGRKMTVQTGDDAVDFNDKTKWELLEEESKTLFTALTTAGKALDDRDNSEKMAYFRTATSLLERIVNIQERAMNLRKIHQFQTVVMQIMDDILDGDQRTSVRQRLEEACRGD